ncbi:MAG: hypothetical protein MZV64_25130 [Ignavibacteriales bacterium]|nr:hypothetical protein [Ignavibacteriales bacterium]
MLVPAPVKAALEPEPLAPGVAPEALPLANPSLAPLLQGLDAAGVLVFDPAPVLAEPQAPHRKARVPGHRHPLAPGGGRSGGPRPGRLPPREGRAGGRPGPRLPGRGVRGDGTRRPRGHAGPRGAQPRVRAREGRRGAGHRLRGPALAPRHLRRRAGAGGLLRQHLLVARPGLGRGGRLHRAPQPRPGEAGGRHPAQRLRGLGDTRPAVPGARGRPRPAGRQARRGLGAGGPEALGGRLATDTHGARHGEPGRVLRPGARCQPRGGRRHHRHGRRAAGAQRAVRRLHRRLAALGPPGRQPRGGRTRGGGLRRRHARLCPHPARRLAGRAAGRPAGAAVGGHGGRVRVLHPWGAG